MICNKCNHVLPDDSVFCQYCGNKIKDSVLESEVFVNNETTVSDSEVVLDDELLEWAKFPPEKAKQAILESHFKDTIILMGKNYKEQPNNENDPEFGLVPEKPIYTQALMSVEGEKEYLNKLCTVNGQKIKYNRIGSMSVDGINGMIDIYDTFLPSGQFYKKIYINMYGARDSIKAPVGFTFIKPKTSSFKGDTCIPKSTSAKNNLPSEKLVVGTNISVLVLIVISMFSIVVAMNIQDIKRNYFENWNVTAVYLVLLMVLGSLLVFSIFSLIKKRFEVLAVLSFASIVTTIIAIAEGSILSYEYYNNYHNTLWHYYDYEVIEVFNIIWIVSVILAFIISFLPVGVTIVKNIKNNRYRSVSYREKCYKRVAEIHNYFEKGIITKEEYEKTKSDILKNIQ